MTRFSAQQIFDLVPAIFFVFDKVGTIVEVNAFGAAELGYPIDALLGQSFRMITYAEDEHIFEHQIMTCQHKTDQIFHAELRKQRKDGSLLWVRESARCVRSENDEPYVIIACEDLSAQKRVEASLRRSEALYRMIIETSREGLWMIDAEGRTVLANQGMATMLGYDEDTLLGHSLFEFIDAQWRPIAERNIARRRKGIREVHDFEFRRKDGSRFWALVSATPVFDEQDHYIGAFAMVSDISDRKRAEEELARRAQALEQANARLRQLDSMRTNFVNAVSHELRTPLTSILGYAEFLEDQVGGPLTDEQRAEVHEITEGAHRLQHLVDDLLDFARLEAGTFRLAPTETDLVATVQRVLASLAPSARAKSVQLVPFQADHPVGLMCDAKRVEQILTNLIANAIKFTLEGGRVWVTLDELPQEVRVSVHDTGIGIPASLQPHLFERFFQADASDSRGHGGVGLGLSIVKALVQAHGGQVGVESHEGEGSRFWFSLPRSPAPQAAA